TGEREAEITLEATISCVYLENNRYEEDQSLEFKIEGKGEIAGGKITEGFPSELLEWYSNPEKIGSGGFARVYRVQRKEDGIDVALKVPIQFEDRSTGKTFMKEISSWNMLEHPNIVILHDCNVLPSLYLEMELCEHSFESIERPMEPTSIVGLVFQICEGLKCAHEKGIIHRDLKPANIMLKRGVPKITDWGLSKVKTESSSSSVASLTLFYAAPEQFSAKVRTDERTDIFQLGIILYEMVTGQRPFDGRDPAAVMGAILSSEDPEIPSKLVPGCEGIEPVIMKCLEKQKEARYQNVNELQ
ncbi:MAG: serine/threonine protein kinase, partial [bacterium]|nr:serine/threonine protein kinase [bacterium]